MSVYDAVCRTWISTTQAGTAASAANSKAEAVDKAAKRINVVHPIIEGLRLSGIVT